MISRTFIALFLQISCVAFAWDWGGSSKQYSCSSNDKVCKLTQVILATPSDIEQAKFEDLHDPLIVESGNIPHFTEALARKLPTISDLKLDGVGMVKLYVRPDFTSLSATGNAIDELLLDKTDEEPYSMLWLKLSQNKLTTLPPLERFVKLYVLELDYNLLTTVDMAAFSTLTGLRELSLAHNRLHTVTSQVQLYRLKKLSFAGNNLTSLDVHGWEMDSLAEFSVHSNSLNLIEGNLTQFSALTSLAVAGNQLYCHWLMAEPILVNPSPKLKIDSDTAEYCEANNFMRYMDHCCTERGKGGFGLLDVYHDKWAQLERLTELIGSLHSAIKNGSATVKPVLERQHETLTTRLDNLRSKQESHTEDLRSLKEKADQHRANLGTFEKDVSSLLVELRTELDSKWNQTLSALESNGTNGQGALPSANWTQATVQQETNLSHLRKELETVRKQFNLYMGEYYDQRNGLKVQSSRLDELEKKLTSGQNLHRELGKKYDRMENRVSAIYEYFKLLGYPMSSGSAERLDESM